MSIKIDLTSLDGWQDLAPGTYSITLRSKAEDKITSVDSASVEYTKQQTGEIWVINEWIDDLSLDGKQFNINFSSNGQSFSSISFANNHQETVVEYKPTTLGNFVGFDGDVSGWSPSSDYRTVTFETAPTGELLEWLQTNAVKYTPQPSPSGFTVTLNLGARRGGQVLYKVNDGEVQTYTKSGVAEYETVSLTDVSKLEICCNGYDVTYVKIDGTSYYPIEEWQDFTQYLYDGVTVEAYADDY